MDELLAEAFGNWHVETAGEVVQLRVTKKGAAQVHTSAGTAPRRSTHDRAKQHLLDPGDPLFNVIGGGGDKRRQVDAFLRSLEPVLDDALAAGRLPDRPLRVVDLGCGNAYLTFAAFRYLTATKGLPVRMVGVDVRPQARKRNTEIAARLEAAGSLEFREGTIREAPVPGADIVLALHACDTATDEALARAVQWRAPLLLASPCCHHDISRQLQAGKPPAPYSLLTRHGILRERFADTLTDALRAALLRMAGYRVDVVEFVDSAHTPRNLLLRAVRTGGEAPAGSVEDYRALVGAWGVRPCLEQLLGDELPGDLGAEA